MFLNDTIAAIATPIGEGGIGIVRISGPQAKDIGNKLLRKSNRSEIDIEDHRIYHGFVVDPQTGANIDEVLFFYAQKPHSYTAEDTLEIQAHGGALNLAKILELVLKQDNTRMAEPGEFTLRAFLNGRIDLVQAESIIDLIRAKTDKAHELALSQLTGKVTKAIKKIEDDLYQILISIEAVLDFPEEGLPEPIGKKIKETGTAILQKLNELILQINEGRKIREGIGIVITGRPNVGKSSLLNCFLQEERAIVTEIPGTTRDVIETQFQLQGIPIRLYDTAGLRTTENPIEQMGIKKAEQYINDADLVLLMLDGSEPLTEDDQLIMNKLDPGKTIVIINKTDLPQRLDKNKIPAVMKEKQVELSALTGKGFANLEKLIINAVGLGAIQVDDRPLLSRVRHKKALEQAVNALQSFLNGLDQGISEDLLAVDLRLCLAAIGEITGKNVSEEVLQGIFSQFCIGK